MDSTSGFAKGKGKQLASLPPEHYTVGWICAIPIELKAARAMLDENHDQIDRQAKSDNNNYILGRIGSHNVVLACLSEYGVVSAAVAANSLLNTFKNIRFGLMVGVGGGIPSSDCDIRLGDIAVSQPSENSGGVIQYDLGRAEIDGFKVLGMLNKPLKLLLTAMRVLQATRNFGREILSLVNEAFGEDGDDDDSEETWAYPGVQKDTLFKADFNHINRESTCEKCKQRDQVMEVRAPRKTTNPKTIYGNIASGNRLMKNALERDALAQKHHAICFEMEAAGLMDDFPCLVIRGICDYSDSHKNKEWQPYAAAVAAAYAKSLLGTISAQAIEQDQPARRNQHWMVPRQVNPHFTGRKEVLDQLRTQLCRKQDERQDEQRRFIIHSMGGAGKSEVCLKFAYANRKSFWGIFWLDASDDDTTKRGIITAAQTAFNESDLSLESAKLRFANEEKDWLLIFDNADNTIVDYFRYFPSGAGGSILMTTRNPDCQKYQTVGTLGEEFEQLGFDDSISLLLRSAQVPPAQWEDFKGDAKKMVGDQLLTQHALAITQAGAFISQRLCSFKEYPKMFKNQRERLLTHGEFQARPQYGDVYATFEVSAQAMESASKPEWKDALALLQVLAFLHREGVPEEMFTKAWNYSVEIAGKELDEDIESLSVWHVNRLQKVLHGQGSTKELDLMSFRMARNALQSFSLVKVNEESGDISMHPLVHSWAKDRLSPGDKPAAWAMSASVLCLSIDELEYQDFFKKIEVHIEVSSLFEPEKLFRQDIEWRLELCQILYSFAWVLYNLNKYLGAIHLARILLSRYDHEIQSRSLNFRHIQYLLALCLQEEDQLAQAFELSTEVMEFDKENTNVSEHSRVNAQDAFARSLLELGNVSEGINQLQKILRRRQDTLPPDHENVLKSKNHLAYAYTHNKQLDKAIELLEEVVRVQEKSLQPTDPKRLKSQHNLAYAYMESKQLEQAIGLFEEVVRVQERSLQPTHPKRLRAQHNLAYTYMENKQLEKAIELYKEVVTVEESCLKPTDPKRLKSQHNLAYTYVESKQLDKAIELFEEVVRVNERSLQPTHPKRLRAQHILAYTYVENKQLEKAIELYKEVVTVEESCLKPTDPKRLESQHNLATAYYRSGQFQKGLDIIQEVVPIRGDVLKPENSQRIYWEELLRCCKEGLEGQSKQDGESEQDRQPLKRSISNEPLGPRKR